jgi:nitrogen-specific signal transduction histidine kinase
MQSLDFDESVEKINVVPRNIGRVLLNLFNNAFYAVNKRSKIEGENFKPSVETKPIKEETGLGLSLRYDIIKVLGAK